MSDLAELARRRGFYFPAADAYGGVSGFYVYGPEGAALKRNVEDAFRDRFVVREGHDEVESPTVVPEPVFEASGHLEDFDDALVACPDCDRRHRADHLVEAATDLDEAESVRPVAMEDLLATHDVRCPDCDGRLAGQSVESFNLMFRTSIGPGEDRPGYLRPETAQGTLVEFPRLAEYARGQLPTGVAQVGRAYRNEISPRNAVVRQRELTLAELQVFYHPDRDAPPVERVASVPLTLYPADRQGDADPDYVETTVAAAAGNVVPNEWVAYYLGVVDEFFDRVGVDTDRLRFRQHPPGERTHYATDCWDPEVRVDGEWIELAGVAYRSDYDLARHADATGEDYAVFREFDEPRTVERTVVDPDMSRLGPRFGDRTPDVVEALERRAETDPAAFEDDAVTVTVRGESLSVPTDAVEVRVETTEEHGERVRPHVVEPSIGVDRVVYAALAHSYEVDVVDRASTNASDSRDASDDRDVRTRLALPPSVAPTLAAVFPLTDDHTDRARDLAGRLRRRGLSVTVDDSGSIGRRYRRQDEVGTPFCVTVDHRTAEDDTVTLRDRDSTEQVRVPADDLPRVLADLRAGVRTFADLD